jgi:hypothetical protein
MHCLHDLRLLLLKQSCFCIRQSVYIVSVGTTPPTLQLPRTACGIGKVSSTFSPAGVFVQDWRVTSFGYQLQQPTVYRHVRHACYWPIARRRPGTRESELGDALRWRHHITVAGNRLMILIGGVLSGIRKLLKNLRRTTAGSSLRRNCSGFRDIRTDVYAACIAGWSVSFCFFGRVARVYSTFKHL